MATLNLSVAERERRAGRRFNGVLVGICALIGAGLLRYSIEQDSESIADVMRYAGAGLLTLAAAAGTFVGLDRKGTPDGVLIGLDTDHDANARFVERGEAPKVVEAVPGAYAPALMVAPVDVAEKRR